MRGEVVGDEGTAVIETALGRWRLRWTKAGLRAFHPTTDGTASSADAPVWVRNAAAVLKRHLDGDAQDLGALPLDLSAFTPFHLAVAEALRRTRGGAITYGGLAALAGHPGAARSVGRFVRDNPLLVLIPCHRVVGASGPGGWSAFGAPGVKARLMALDPELDQRP